jgi:hypothetical protein
MFVATSTSGTSCAPCCALQATESELLLLLKSPSLGTTLTSLNLDGCGGVTGEVVATVGRVCRSLTALDISRSRAIQDTHLAEYAGSCSGGLARLSLVWCSQVCGYMGSLGRGCLTAGVTLHHAPQLQGCW